MKTAMIVGLVLGVALAALPFNFVLGSILGVVACLIGLSLMLSAHVTRL
jgi:hypothetical protein